MRLKSDRAARMSERKFGLRRFGSDGGRNVLVFIAAAIVAAAFVTSSRVEGGASSSAPSRYSRVSANQQRQDTNFPITEYSSSARPTSQHKH
jgi:hypothetical protein